MTDIVERLKPYQIADSLLEMAQDMEIGKVDFSAPGASFLRESADCISRQNDEIERLRADNERLRAALRESAIGEVDLGGNCRVRWDSIEIARRALEGKDEGGVMRNPAIVSVRSEIDDIRDCLAGSDVGALPNDYPTCQMARDRMDDLQRLRNELQRLRNALIKICDRAHKPQVGVISDSFNIAVNEAKTLLNETMNRPPYLHVGGQS